MTIALDDTIAAISTPVGEGGIGIVRLSGPMAGAILEQVFVRASPATRPSARSADAGWNEAPTPFESRRFHYGHVVDSDTAETVDEVLAVYMCAPHTYTRQDVAEIHCHGGIVPLRRVLELVLRRPHGSGGDRGARLAQPGEFTLRAFLNGRLDLAQAEAVLDIIHAKTEASLRIAVGQLEGRMSQPMREIRASLLQALAHLEASLDFPEDEIPDLDIAGVLQGVVRQLAGLLAQADQGMVYRQGVRTVIVGRPNVGKSSLLNALLHTSRAIVTPIPGTTRDTVEETLNLGGVPLCLVDTAGITRSDDPIEKLGIERSRCAMESADLLLLVLDGSEPLTAQDQELAQGVGNRSAVVVVNKTDLPAVADCEALLPMQPHVSISALTGMGLADLEATIKRTVLSGDVQTSDLPVVSSPRHREILARALGLVNETVSGFATGVPEDLLAVDLSSAVGALGEITGESVSDDVLATIFSGFCIGK